MRTLNGIYRAVCLGSDPEAGTIRCHVPQIFAEETVTCFDSVGTTPVAGSVGWVAFESGYPDRPVWMSGGGGGSAADDEVWVGPEDPGGLYELWYDTDASPAGGGFYITRGYRWTKAIDATDPGSGRIKSNTTDAGLTTALYMSSYDINGTAFINMLSMRAGDLLAIYLDNDIGTRCEYTLSGAPTNNTNWLTVPVTVTKDLGFTTTIPANNASVEVTIQPSTGGGGGGTSGPVAYTHNQGVVASTWTVVHNLGWYPNVTVIDSAGTTVEGDITQVNSNQLTIKFSGAFTGVAYLS